MSLWRYPRTAAALCIAAVLACAAAPAAFSHGRAPTGAPHFWPPVTPPTLAAWRR